MRQLSLLARTFTAGLLLQLLCSCATPKLTLSIPAPEAVGSVEISDGYLDKKQQHIVYDRKTISDALRLVEGHNSGWSVPFGTFPTPKASASFNAQDGTVLFVLWFGPEWIGARSFQGEYNENVTWAPGNDVQQQLRRLFAIGA